MKLHSDKVVLAGFSSWGYTHLIAHQTKPLKHKYYLASVLPYLSPNRYYCLPDAHQWPAEAWAQPLRGIGWHLVDSADNSRTVFFDDKKQAIIRIQITKSNRILPKRAGDIVFKHLT
ncbi:DUF3261 domain-containing protein [Vibrio chagasii]|nr:DUF3261 domain-containing protein [Vibrio chagasii]